MWMHPITNEHHVWNREYDIMTKGILGKGGIRKNFKTSYSQNGLEHPKTTKPNLETERKYIMTLVINPETFSGVKFLFYQDRDVIDKMYYEDGICIKIDTKCKDDVDYNTWEAMYDATSPNFYISENTPNVHVLFYLT